MERETDEEKSGAECRIEKKQASGRRRIFTIAIIAVIIIAIVGAYFVYTKFPREPDFVDDKVIAPSLDAAGENFLISKDNISSSKFNYYAVDSGSTTIRFFAVLGSDGEVHTAFDACDVCYNAKKGYEKDGSRARCRNCGNKYSINDLGTKNKGGGCWPGMLKHSVSGSEIVIPLTEINNNEYYFK